MSETTEPSPPSDLILYQTKDGKTRIQCRFEDESIWLTQAQIAELYQKDVKTINEHLLNIYEDKELDEDSTIRKFRIVRLEGKREVTREISHYSLQAILAVGLRGPTGEALVPPRKRHPKSRCLEEGLSWRQRIEKDLNHENRRLNSGNPIATRRGARASC